MRRESAGLTRAGMILPALAAAVFALLSSGCRSFESDWKKAGTAAAITNADPVSGHWEGTWRSDVNGHHDRLRCVVTQQDDGTYRARFHAKYRKVLSFGYTVPLRVEWVEGKALFSGEADLGWLAGGVYHYAGQADGTGFVSTYSCKYDHGTFQMSRPSPGASPRGEGEALLHGRQDAPLADARQLLLVTTKDWNSVPGVLRRFERKDADSPWREVDAAIPVVVGRNGMGWGRGLCLAPASASASDGPVKREGDGRSPAGLFRLGSAFGLATPEQATNLRLPYQPLSDLIECVDDVKSVHYNSIVDRGRVASVDWNSSEKMREIGAQYRLGVVVDHNTDPRVAGGGSCIFIHIWKSAKTGTSGCTAMASEQIEKLLPWLDPAAHPTLAQMPEAEYARLKTLWNLP